MSGAAGRLKFVAFLFALFACLVPFAAESGFPLAKSIVCTAVAVGLYLRRPFWRLVALACVFVPLLLLSMSPLMFLLNGRAPQAEAVLGLSAPESTLLVLLFYVAAASVLGWAFYTLRSATVRALFSPTQAVA